MRDVVQGLADAFADVTLQAYFFADFAVNRFVGVSGKSTPPPGK